MNSRGPLTKILSVVGTILVWLPLIAPLALSAVRLAQANRLQVDYLMPAEFFPVALLGGMALLWAALRARSHRRLVAWSLGAAVGLLAVSMAAASITGLASGDAEPAGWRLVVVVGLIAGYVGALLVLGVGGVSLIRGLLGKSLDSAGG